MLPFSKAHAYGNDFLYVRAADTEGRESARPPFTSAIGTRALAPTG